MVDNSQGHSAYSKDALLVQNMNLGPGGKQSVLRDGWMVLLRWQTNLSAHGISIRSSQQRLAKRYSAGSYQAGPLVNWFVLTVQAALQSWGNQLLCKVTTFSSARFSKSD